MAIGDNKHVRYALGTFMFILSVIGLNMTPSLLTIQTFLYGENTEDISIIISKVFIDICVMLCFIWCLFRSNKQHRQQKWVLLMPIIALKCIEILLFIIGSILLMKYGSADNIFDEVSQVFVLAVCLFIGYWGFSFFLYAFVKCYQPDLNRGGNFGRADNANNQNYSSIQLL